MKYANIEVHCQSFATYCAFFAFMRNKILTHAYFHTGGHSVGVNKLVLRLDTLSTQVQRLSRERQDTQLNKNALTSLLQRYLK